jgi:hypothetical protein
MRKTQQTKKIKTPKVAGAIGIAILALTYALNSIPGGFFCIILLISVLILMLANFSIFLKNIRKNFFEAFIALLSIIVGAYVFFNAKPSEMYRSDIILIATPEHSDKKKIAFRENGLISISPKSLKSIVSNTEAFYELKNDTIIIQKRKENSHDFLPDTCVISDGEIISISKEKHTKESSVNKNLIIIEDKRSSKH